MPSYSKAKRSVPLPLILADILSLKKDDESSGDIPLEEVPVALIKTPMWPQAGRSTVAAMNCAAAILKNSGKARV
ncbi:Amidase [Penicillium soppii]|uniref:Amidase n=1 Tax=Penicillium soppii TaxID=69789 RepID=UPI002548159F|nr:Amidase [Penicillium soppii]KAJ5864099.1 Amidase [Penicillium soppii]